jgi:tRNA(Arg) A34 adenosine deaminase TadA
MAAFRKAVPKNPHRFFLAAACEMAGRNIEETTGGPFGAVLVHYDKATPTILGLGTNQVLANKSAPDPTAHAEIVALRDALRRHPKEKDLFKKAVLYSSCECCPMCLSAALAAGIRTIYFASTRGGAERAGFTDKAQYDLLKKPLSAHATLLSSLPPVRQHTLRKILRKSEAVVLDETGNALTRIAGKGAEPPSMRAIRAACKKRRSIDLSACTLLLQKAPHPAGAIAADWAKIGRVWNPQKPLRDTSKHPAKVIYLSEEMETMGLKKGVAPAALYAAFRKNSFAPATIRHLPVKGSEDVWDRWKRKTRRDSARAY